MRQKRLKAAPHLEVSYYHCVSRVVDRQFIFGDVQKEYFVRLMRLYETFCGLRLMTFCVMSNHFHLLLEIPRRPDGFFLSDDDLLERLKPVNSSLEINTLREKLDSLRKNNAHAEADAIKEKIYARMFDLSNYMKLLKGRFTQWYNRSQKRVGTLWEDRFKSVLVEARGEALTLMSAYIDLNPVRAGMVDDPKDYRWSGYGEAVGGKREAITGLKTVVETWEAMFGNTRLAKTESAQSPDELTREEREWVLSRYRLLAYNQGQEGALSEEGNPLRRGFTEEEIAAVIANKGKLSRWELLRCRVRYFSDGLVFGGKSFVNEVFVTERSRFGATRKSGAKPLRGLDIGELKTMRDLRRNPIGPR